MINIIQNTIGALGRVLGIVRKNLQLWLDFNKSEVIGSEEVVNGDFATDLSGWTLDTSRGSYAWDVGRIKITNDAANSYANCSQDIATTIGGIYRVRGTVEIGTATTIEFRATRVGGNASQQLSSDGTIDFTFIADQASTKLLCYLWSPTGNTDDYCYFDNISVKEVTQFVKDKSPNTNNAKLFTGKALSFNGNDSVDISSFQMVGGVATFAFWVNPSTTIGKVLDFNDSTSSDNRLAIGFFSNTFRLYSGAVGADNLIEFGDLTLNTYSRVVIAINGTSVSCYVNNSQLGSTGTIEGIDLSTIDEAAIGSAYWGTSDNITAELSDLQIYNKSWTASDVAFDYNNPNHLAIDNPDTDLVVTDLKGYWALSEGDGSVAYDSSGEGNSGNVYDGAVIGSTYVDKQPTIPQLGMMDWAKGSNLIPYSEDFTSWNSYQATTNTTTSPRGNSVLFLDFEDVRMFPTNTISNSTEYTSSIYLKANKVADVKIRNVAGQDTVISLTTNWERYELTATSSSTSTNALLIDARFSEGLGAVGLEIALYAAQINEGSSAGNYILTDGAAAIDVTTIQNPTNKGYDILGNALRLRENAFNLDGTGYAEVADSDSLDITTAITLEAWVFINDENGKGIISKWKGTGKPYMMYKGTNFFRLYIDQISLTSSTTPLNEWVHCVATYDGTTMKSYVNADENTVTTKANSASINTNTDNVEIGRYQGLDSKIYSERIDEPRIYNRALTQKEITNNYKIGLRTHS